MASIQELINKGNARMAKVKAPEISETFIAKKLTKIAIPKRPKIMEGVPANVSMAI
ncbi:MAG: hypothetical protein BWX46_00706 [Candidatus Cloacimonetes bacterium ADurb.Bin003]|nr:MAG: hypothetical protein BWX46_00706 [Candidatus Cloacimonetes bacterium ADurb.Bin003]